MKIRNLKSTFLIPLILLIFGCKKEASLKKAILVDHQSIDLKKIPLDWIKKAKSTLHIAYGHTSYGSQLITGMDVIESEIGDPYLWNNGTLEGSLDIRDAIMSGDLGQNGDVTWAATTRSYLGDWRNADINVILWSWGDGVSTSTEQNIKDYLDAMNQLENDYPNVKFVYMTGHLDGTGETGNLNAGNEQIRKYCKENNKTLYDFADIESYDPEGHYFLDRLANGECQYDSDNSGTLDIGDGNWAIDWQNSHTEGIDWYQCSPANTQPINGNMKGYAAWWLFAGLAGWDGN